jgi:hypothetical protein
MGANPDSNDETKDRIHFAIQGAADMAQVTIAVAEGIFGILSMFALLQTSEKGIHFGQLGWFMSWGMFPAFVILTAACFGISLLGCTCFVYRRQF